jgi:hypothetical protein
MKMQSSENSAGRIQALLLAFFDVRNITVSPDSLRMWIDAFSDMTPQGIEMAIRRFNRESTDYPTPAAVRKYAGVEGLNDEQRASIAWGTVRKTIAQYGAYYSIAFDDAVIHAAIRAIGGWERLCETPHDQMQWKQKEFVRAYVEAAGTGIGDSRPLAGVLGFKERADVQSGLGAHPTHKRLTGPSEVKQRIPLPNLSVDR